MCDPEQEVTLRKISDQVVKLTAKYGGLMWGEHGRGFRSEYGPEFFGGLFVELRRIKGAFDPDNRLNPGKICTPINSNDELVSVDATKRGAYDRQIPVKIRDSFKEALDCNGNGLCFTFETSSPMCPSFKLSGDRRESPKGRAGLMREWLRQLEVQGVDVLTEEGAIQHGVFRWKDLVDRALNTFAKRRGEYDFSHEVMDAMQSCLACKACSSQCPIKVDVPSFRSRFMQLYHQRYLRPAKDYFVATVETYAPLMAKAPGAVNFFLKQNWVQTLTEKTIGMVDVPILSQPTLKQHLAGHEALLFQLEKLEAMSLDARRRLYSDSHSSPSAPPLDASMPRRPIMM
jgi:ferredoxin